MSVSSPFAVHSDVSPAPVTAAGFPAARAELKEIVFQHPELYPDDQHSQHYHREMLSGDKPFHVSCFAGMLARIVRCRAATGRELVRAIGDLLFGQFGMRLVDIDAGANVEPAATIDEEQLEACIAVSHLHVLVDEAERIGDSRTRRAAKRAAAKARAEIADIERHPLLAGEASS